MTKAYTVSTHLFKHLILTQVCHFIHRIESRNSCLLMKCKGNYAVRQRENDLIKEVQKNQEEILRLRQRLARAQTGYPDPDPAVPEVDDANEETTIIKLA